MDLFSRRPAEKTCLSISRRWRKPASPASMKGRLSNTKKSQTKEKHRQRISRFNADLAESSRHALSLADSCLSAAFPALLAATVVRKKVGDCPIGFDLPAR